MLGRLTSVSTPDQELNVTVSVSNVNKQRKNQNIRIAIQAIYGSGTDCGEQGSQIEFREQKWSKLTV